MKIAVFDIRPFEREPFEKANSVYHHNICFFKERLSEHTVSMAAEFPAVCPFVYSQLDGLTLSALYAGGTRLIALRSAGFNNVDIRAARKMGLRVVRVPEYSPYAIAEHAVALILALNRKIPRAAARVRELDFSLDGLVGFDLHGKTVGVIGTGRIGSVFARIMKGFGCHVIANDIKPDAKLTRDYGVDYTGVDEICRRSDIISIHAPLTRETHYLIDYKALALMKPGVIVINTGRGALIDTSALIRALKSGRVGGAGLDVYEEEEGVFSRDLSDRVLQDDVLARLLTFPNVLITAHQGFLTREALTNIAETTLRSVQDFEKGIALACEVNVDQTLETAALP